jgi:FkbM family methyltransferase
MQISPDEPKFFVFDFRGSLTPIFVYQDMQRSKPIDMANDRLAIDLGANVGCWSFRMAKLYPECHFIAYEPHPENINNFKMGLVENDVKNVELMKTAVTHDARDLTLIMDPTNSGSASAYNLHESAMWPRHRVKSITLNDVFERHQCVDLLKVDIEGGEFFLFEGFNHWDKLKKIFIEVHPRYAGFTDIEKTHSIKVLLELLRSKIGAQNVFVECTDEKFRDL